MSLFVQNILFLFVKGINSLTCMRKYFNIEFHQFFNKTIFIVIYNIKNNFFPVVSQTEITFVFKILNTFCTSCASGSKENTMNLTLTILFSFVQRQDDIIFQFRLVFRIFLHQVMEISCSYQTVLNLCIFYNNYNILIFKI